MHTSILVINLFTIFYHDNVIAMNSLYRRIRIYWFGRSTRPQCKSSLLKSPHHTPTDHPPETTPIGGLVLAKLFSHLVECSAFLEGSHGFHDFGLLLAEDVADFDGCGWFQLCGF